MKQSLFSISLILSPLIFWGQVEVCSTIVLPQLSEATKKNFEEKLYEARKNYLQDSSDAEAIIWYGRRTAYLGNYPEAIRIFSRGIVLYPTDARMYRHRAHRYITVRCFDKAIDDLKIAARLIKGNPDEVEPDGLPNPKNIPTSTLQSNTWYHLGLAYYLIGNYKKAAKAYRQCLQVSKNSDMYVATANWLYITLRKLRKFNEAQALLETISPGMELIENKDYLEILLLYKNQPVIDDPIKWLQENKQGLGLASFGYGLANYLLQHGETAKARKVLEYIIASNQWSAFGFIAAELEVARMK